MKHVKTKNVTVEGSKIISIDSKINGEGFMEDKWGNKVYRTDSPENIARLESLKVEEPMEEVNKEKVAVKVAKTPKPRKKKS